jgi:Kef-type K+ transport system membrane component KefB
VTELELERLLLQLVLLMGVTIVLATLIRALFGRIGVPSLVGFIVLGMAMQLADVNGTLFSVQAREVFAFLGNLGVVMLLFRVGLASNLPGLLKQLWPASQIWFWTILASGGLGFATTYWLLDYGLIPSLFVAIALTATSVGVAVGVWQEAGALNSKDGQLLLDVAELDDISAVIFMALLLALSPILRAGQTDGLTPIVIGTTGLFLGKVVLFSTGCYLFSRYLERPITGLFERFSRPPEPMLTVVGIGLIFAALAGLLGFTVAIGAFFAGLVFSRDPRAVVMEASFNTLYHLFVPFFFIDIGLQIDLGSLNNAWGLGVVLFLAAVLGKLLGAGLPTALLAGTSSGVLIGVSMVPRAEIAMIVMHRGASLGGWAVPSELFAAVIFVAAVTSLLVPLVLRSLLVPLVLRPMLRNLPMKKGV